MNLSKFKKWIYIRLEYRLIKMLIKVIFLLKFTDEIIQSQRENLSSRVYKNYQGVVAFGLFQGLKLNAYTAWSGNKDTGSKILGLYENQILDWFQNKYFDLFIDIGAADGYYAVGLLISKKVERAITFEISNSDIEISKSLAIANGVFDKIDFRGKATEDEITLILPQSQNGLILMDIEGGEFELVSENLLKLAKNYSFFIELHEFFDTDLERDFIELCCKFHDVEIIYGFNRNFPIDQFLLRLSDNDRALLLSEGRPNGMKWLVLSPRLLD